MCSPPTCHNEKQAKSYFVGGIIGCIFPFGIGAMVSGCCGAGCSSVIIGILQLITSFVGVGFIWSLVWSILMIVESVSYSDRSKADVEKQARQQKERNEHQQQQQQQQQNVYPFGTHPQNYGGAPGGAPQAHYVVQGGGHQTFSPGWHPAVGVAPYGSYVPGWHPAVGVAPYGSYVPTATGGTALTVNAPPAGHGYS